MDGSAGCGCVPRQQFGSPARIGLRQPRRFGKQPCQVAVRIKSVLLRRLNQAEDHSAALCSSCRVRKQEVLPGDHKGLDAAFGPVVAQFNSAVEQIVVQIRPLVLQIGEGFPQRGLRSGAACSTVYGTRSYSVSYVGTISNTDWSYLPATADNRITITTYLANQPSVRVVVQATEIK